MSLQSFTRPILFVSLCFAVLIAWGSWVGSEDLYTALCAGRDVLEGKLAAPDQWSYTTDGRVWVNQAWLSGLIFYASYLCCDKLGPVALKGLALIACLILLFFRCLRLGASINVAFVALIVGVLGLSPLLSIRPEIFGLVCFVALMSLLTAPPRLGLWRQLGSVLIICLWSNLHGSFMLGIALVGLRAAVVPFSALLERPALGAKASSTDSSSDRPNKDDQELAGRPLAGEFIPWGAACVASVFGAGYVNPYGLGNLLVPFRQVGSDLWVSVIPHWLPLIKVKLTGGLDISIYPLSSLLLAALGGFAVMAAVCSIGLGRAGLKSFLLRRPGSRSIAIVAMECLCFLVLLALTFRFGRLGTFLSLSMIPVAALLLEGCKEAFSKSTRTTDHEAQSPVFSLAAPVSASAALALILWFLLTHTVPAYLPGNPFFPDSSITSRMLRWYDDRDELAEFMKRNRIEGRVFANWTLADYLLLKLRGISVFLGCRAQSMYTDETLEHFQSIMYPNPVDKLSVLRSLGLMNKYQVAAVVLENQADASALTDVLLRAPDWKPTYVDVFGVVFVRSSATQLNGFKEEGRGDLWYPSNRSRVLSEAFFRIASRRPFDAKLMSELQGLAQKTPVSLIYNAIALASIQPNGRLKDEARAYLLSELQRLSGVKILRPEGVNVVESMLEICRVLAIDEQSRGRAAVMNFGAVQARLQGVLQNLRREYVPWSPEPRGLSEK